MRLKVILSQLKILRKTRELTFKSLALHTNPNEEDGLIFNENMTQFFDPYDEDYKYQKLTKKR